MEIIHRIIVNTTDEKFLLTVNEMGVEHTWRDLPGAGGRLVVLEISESHPHWNAIVALIQTKKIFEIYGKGDFFETTFSDDEIRKAPWLWLIPTFEQGYPQPQSTWPIKQSSLELFCSKCCRHRQIASMRLKKEPHMGRKSFVTPIWTGNTFCTPEVFEAFEEIGARGFHTRDVVIHKTGEAIKNVRQLCVPGIANPGMIPYEGLVKKICPECGQPKYYPYVKGMLQIRKEALLPDTDFMLTHEWFGSGYIAFREMLVSNRIANLILDKGWRGVRFKVVELV